MKKLFRLDIFTPEIYYDQILGILCVESSTGWEEKNLPEGRVVLSVHADNQEALNSLRDIIKTVSDKIETELVEYQEQAWQSAWKEYFTPINVGDNFIILPSWLREQPCEGRKKIIIEPAFAFGTGHHATTRLCIASLDKVLSENRVKPNMRFMDLGCGSGILGIAAALSGLSGVGLDIDDLSIRNAIKNAELNNIDTIRFVCGSIENDAVDRYDLIMANILAKPLIEMASDLTERLKKDGILILSGILDTQAAGVIAAYRQNGLPKPQILIRNRAQSTSSLSVLSDSQAVP